MHRVIRVKQSNYKYICLILFCSVSFATNMYQAQLAPLSEQIMKTYDITRAQYSSLYSCGMIPSLFLSIPSAWIIRKFGMKRCECITLGFGIIGLALRLLSSDYRLFYVGTMMTGTANIIISTFGAALFADLFEKDKVSIALGSIIASGAAGKALGEAVTLLIPTFTYLTAIDVCTESLILLAWITLMKNPKIEKSEHSFMETVQNIVHNRYMWIGATILMMVFGTYLAISANLPSILQARGQSASMSGVITSGISIGYFIGAVTLPKLSVYFKHKKRFMSALAVTSALSALLIFYGKTSFLIESVVLIGICVGGLLPMTLSVPATALRFGSSRNQVASSFMSTFQLLGAVMLPSVVIIPLAHDSLERIIIISAGCMIMEAVLCMLLPGHIETNN